MCFKMFVLLLFILIPMVFSTDYTCPSSSLSSSSSPGDNFDLSEWKLTLPDSSVSEKSPTQLEDGYTSSYFYTSSDGSMTFYCPGDGGTTENAKYPRSELRHMCNPNDDNDNWMVGNGKHQMWAEIKVDSSTNAAKVIVAQIHGFESDPLLKVQWEKSSGNLYAFVLDEDGSKPKYTMAEDIGNDKFDIFISVWTSGKLDVYVNSVKYISQDVSFMTEPCYFKQGNYIQSNDDDDYSTVHTYCLEIYNSGDCEAFS